MQADFIEATTTSIAGTNGDGAVTLTRITGKPLPSDAFGSSARFISYVIHDEVNHYYETGVGNVASDVLTRTSVRLTWNGTTYDNTNPSAFAFGSSPTSGNIKIRISPLADMAVPTIPFVNTTATGSADYGLYSGDCALNAVQNATLSADTEYWTPYLWRGQNEITQIAFNVTTAQASSGLKVVLAEVNSSGLPGAILINFTADAGADTATTGVKTRTPGSGRWSPDNTVRLPVGWYYIGFISGHAIALQTLNVRGLSPAGMTTSYNYNCDHLDKSGSYTTGLSASPTGLTARIPLYRHVFWLKPRN